MPASPLSGLILADVVVEQLPAWYQTWYGLLAIVLAVLLVPVFLGQAIAQSVRMKDYAWKISLILFASMAAGVMVWLGQFNGGIDLAGGTILIYEIDQVKKDEISDRGEQLMEKLITAISQRIDPAGVKQVTIRQYGEEQIEIIIPKVTPEEVKLIKRDISTAGNLEFRILADPDIDTALVQFARNPPATAAAEAAAPWVMARRRIKERDQDARSSNEQHANIIARARAATEKTKVEYNGRERARWVKVPPSEIEKVKGDRDLVTRSTDQNELEQLVVVGQPRAAWVKVGEIKSNVSGQAPRLRVPPDSGTVTRPRDDGGIDMLVVIDELDVDGSYLTRSSPGFRDGRVCVDFQFNGQGAKRFGTLTSLNIPESGRKRRLGIVLDEELLSAPQLNSVIRESGQITGDFTEAEVNWLVGVLNAGRLPAALNREPISEQQVAPTLGEATILAGGRAIAISLITVIAFMPLYYRFSGLVACFALLLNLLLVLGVMVAIGAAFTLPGLAGLVLTVGMAVDANVLIFERIREEMDRGAALRMAIRNGFGRATRTIVDANLTTLITGIVLYVIGTDQIKGFAVTLILGIGMSMFTAIFCARVIFDIAERKRWITKLSMARFLAKTNIDFLGKRHIAALCSLTLICVGLFGVYHRGSDLLDIDFRGGSRFEVAFNKPQNDGELRRKLMDYSKDQPIENQLNDLKVVGAGSGDTDFVIETTQDKLNAVETAIKTVFSGQLRTNTLKFDPAKVIRIPKAAPAEDPDVSRPAGADDTQPAPAGDAPADTNGPAAPDSERRPDGGDPQDKTDKGAAAPSEKDGAGSVLPPSTWIALADNEAVEQPGDGATDADAGIGADASVAQPAEVDAADAGGEPPATETVDPSGPDDERVESGTSESAESVDESAADGSAKPAAEGEVAPEAGSDPAAEEGAKAGAKGGSDAGSDAGSGAGSGADIKKKATPAGPEPPPTVPAVGTEPSTASPPAAPVRFAGGTEVALTFADAINGETLRSLLESQISELNLGSPDFEVSNPRIFGESRQTEKEWRLRTSLSVAETKQLLSAIEKQLETDPVFPSATNIGGQVAGDAQNQAFAALFASLVFIVAYIWIRFQHVTYGLAAVIALVHDVLVTLGMIALSSYVANISGISGPLQMEAFKISLPVLAAFMTIIGYSLNDTIVVFDRIREIRGKSPDLSVDMINNSVNQTLSRTILTSATTLIVVVILYFIGGAGIHGFAFALVVGVVVGTYSSIFVASPALLWMDHLGGADTGAGAYADRTSKKTPVAG